MKISSNLLNLIKQNKSFLIAGHINPEGDSIGSCLALALGIKKMGNKTVSVLSKDPVPENLKFLPSAKTVRQTPPRRKFDVVFLVDCNTPARTGFENFNAKKTAVIDHHVLSAAERSWFSKEVSASLVDLKAAAAGLLVYKVLKALKVPINKQISTNLYTAILVDTGGFRYSNASPDSLSTAGLLVEAGASPWSISKELYENVPFRSMKLLGTSLSTLERKNGLAWITTTEEMFLDTGTTPEDCEDFVNFPRKIRDVEVAVFIRQVEKNSYKLSLRSKGKVDVQKIAKSFGGGGHVAAAGFQIDGTLKAVQSKVFSAVRKAIKES